MQDEGTGELEYLSLDEGTFEVAPGEELSYCVKLPMPEAFRGREMALVGWESDVPAPTHHYFMTYAPESTQGTEPVPCQGDSGILAQGQSGEAFATSGVLNTKILFASGVGKLKNEGRDGYGFVMEADGTFVTNHHVLNTTDEAAQLHGRFKLAVKDASLIPHPVRSLVCSTISVTVPAGQESKTTLTCLAPFDLDVVLMAGHGHALMTRFTAQQYDGKETMAEEIYETEVWDSCSVASVQHPEACAFGVDVGVQFAFVAEGGHSVGGIDADPSEAACVAAFFGCAPADAAADVEDAFDGHGGRFE